MMYQHFSEHNNLVTPAKSVVFLGYAFKELLFLGC